MQTEGLVCTICYLGFLFQTPSGGVFAVPQQIAILIGHFSWDADLVAVEVVGLLASFTFFVDPVVYLCQRFVAAGISVDIGISAVPKSQTNPLSSSRSSERQKLHRNVLHSPRQNLKFYICYALLALVTQTTLADYIYNKSIMSKAKISPNKISFDKFSGSIKVLIF